MTDIVITLALRGEDEVRAFGGYLSRFVESRAREAERAARFMDAPYLMVRDEPTVDGDLRHVVFQLRRAARAFAEGWEVLRADRTQSLA